MTTHVTIVEDDPDVRALLTRSLDSDGYQVTALESGVGIEDAIASNQIDLVGCDCIFDADAAFQRGHLIAIRIQAARQQCAHIGIILNDGDMCGHGPSPATSQSGDSPKMLQKT